MTVRVRTLSVLAAVVPLLALASGAAEMARINEEAKKTGQSRMDACREEEQPPFQVPAQ